MKIITIVGTRPEIIRLSRVIPALDNAFEHILIHTGQNFDPSLSANFFNDLNIREPNYYLNINNKSGSISFIADSLVKIDKILAEELPDAFLILGDTNSSLSLIAAKKRKIPIFHIEAGNRCFDQNVPEEINRKLIDHISDINLTYSAVARENLVKEGIKSETIFSIGSPLDEVLNFYMPKIQTSMVLKSLNLEKKSFILLSLHREENVDNSIKLKKFLNSLNKFVENNLIKVIFSCHPRTKKRIDELQHNSHELIEILPPLNFTDYVNLQINSLIVMSDSGSLTEESSLLKLTSINLRDTHERQESNSRNPILMLPIDSSDLFEFVEKLINSSVDSINYSERVDEYISPDFSNKIVKIIYSYIHYVNKYLWMKET